MTYLAEGLAVNKSLESLDIRSNQISHKGAGELASALKKKNTLKELGVCCVAWQALIINTLTL